MPFGTLTDLLCGLCVQLTLFEVCFSLNRKNPARVNRLSSSPSGNPFDNLFLPGHEL